MQYKYEIKRAPVQYPQFNMHHFDLDHERWSPNNAIFILLCFQVNNVGEVLAKLCSVSVFVSFMHDARCTVE